MGGLSAPLACACRDPSICSASNGNDIDTGLRHRRRRHQHEVVAAATTTSAWSCGGKNDIDTRRGCGTDTQWQQRLRHGSAATTASSCGVNSDIDMGSGCGTNDNGIDTRLWQRRRRLWHGAAATTTLSCGGNNDIVSVQLNAW